MGDSDEDEESRVEEGEQMDSGFVSMSLIESHLPSSVDSPKPSAHVRTRSLRSALSQTSHVAPAKPNYKLLYQTHLLLQNRFLHSSFRLSLLQTRESPPSVYGHQSMIYCLQLYTYPSTGRQVLFTGSRDQTVREWDLESRSVVRAIEGIHTSSVLSICVYNGFLASAGSDRRVVVWDLEKNTAIGVICDHEDSVLCVRFDDERLVTCSKDRTVRTYSFPGLTPQFVLREHRAAVNAVSIYKNLIVSGSGDRSIRLWDAETGQLLRTFDNHHTRGIASIDFKPPYILSGSSDKHLRLFDMTTLRGWSTFPQLLYDADATSASIPTIVSDGVGDPGTGEPGSAFSTNDGFSNAPYPLSSEFLGGTFGGEGIWDEEDEDLNLGGNHATVGTCSCSSLNWPDRSDENEVLVCRDCGSGDIRSVPPNRTAGDASGLVGVQPHSQEFSRSTGLRRFIGAVPGYGTLRRQPPVLPFEVEHKDLVRSVALGERFVISGSYDKSIKVWNRRSGALAADLTGGHVGRIFCIGFDRTKIVSCGEDHRICIWDFAHGVDTSFIQLS
ncbi:hypothetical protein AX17_003884 [Amanita inopinata Kibby_2008]|nr:hypothetical protein AX17_003884 [Amanita inopinata Kibby_2008]